MKLAGWDISLAKVDVYKNSLLTTCPKAKGESSKLVPSLMVSLGITPSERFVPVIAAMMKFHNYHCCSALGTALRLRSGTVKLKDLLLSGNIGDIGVASLGN
eukprot:scaffold38351_cov144-Skeletonema_dohrnii-CCMP3373.AAC.1